MFAALAAAAVAIAVASGAVMMSKQAAAHAPTAPVLYSPSASGGN
jgi:hypothetical protein